MINIKDIPENEFDLAFAIIFQLRPHLTLEQFKVQIVEQKKAGYLLIGAYSPELKGLMGMRPLQTLARGKHLHIDDLVVDKKYKKSGAGSALIEFAQKYAVLHELELIFLDSFSESLGFYKKHGFSDHGSILVKTRVV